MSKIKANVISFRYWGSKDSIIQRKGHNSKGTYNGLYKATHAFKPWGVVPLPKESKTSKNEVNLNFKTLSYDYNEFIQGSNTELNSANNKSFCCVGKGSKFPVDDRAKSHQGIRMRRSSHLSRRRKTEGNNSRIRDLGKIVLK